MKSKKNLSKMILNLCKNVDEISDKKPHGNLEKKGKIKNRD